MLHTHGRNAFLLPKYGDAAAPASRCFDVCQTIPRILYKASPRTKQWINTNTLRRRVTHGPAEESFFRVTKAPSSVESISRRKDRRGDRPWIAPTVWTRSTTS
ncbi:hypothetical protein KM043_008554 [Ampulex compressa]|nr:hypothetical protein KM043_008554 [Ampulex compressa]